MPVLYELKDVRRVFRRGPTEVRAVDGLNLTIDAGDLLAIEGPSGSGKTTLLQLLGGLERVSSGALTFDGADMSSLDDGRLTKLRSREIGFVFQSFNLIPTLTAQQNVETALAPLGTKKAERQARAKELLGQVGLADRADHVPTNLSGGEQQRVAIARALANDPRVILADEPTGNLDTSTSAEVISLLARLSTERNVTVVLVTHAEQVAAAARRRLSMRDGQIVSDYARDAFAPAAAPAATAVAPAAPVTPVAEIETEAVPTVEQDATVETPAPRRPRRRKTASPPPDDAS